MKIDVRCYGGPLDGVDAKLEEEGLLSGMVPVTISGGGRYELARFRGSWTLEWIEPGASSAAEVAGTILEDETPSPAAAAVIDAGVERLGRQAQAGPLPAWHEYLVAHGRMPVPCDAEGLEHDWGPWGATTTARVPGTSSQTCTRCGKGRFKVAEATVPEGASPLEVSAALAGMDEPVWPGEEEDEQP